VIRIKDESSSAVGDLPHHSGGGGLSGPGSDMRSMMRTVRSRPLSGTAMRTAISMRSGTFGGMQRRESIPPGFPSERASRASCAPSGMSRVSHLGGRRPSSGAKGRS
jgi:hypothetical protein